MSGVPQSALLLQRQLKGSPKEANEISEFNQYLNFFIFTFFLRTE